MADLDSTYCIALSKTDMAMGNEHILPGLSVIVLRQLLNGSDCLTKSILAEINSMSHTGG